MGSSDLTDNNTVGYTAGKSSNAANLVATNTEFLSATVGSWADPAVAVSAWIKVPSPPGGSRSFIIYNPSGSGWGAVTTWVLSTNINKLRFFVCNGTTLFAVQSASDVSADTWYHVVATYDDEGDRKPRLKINGGTTLVGSTALTGTWSKSADSLLLFARIPPASTCADCTIDEVGVWSRAITDDECLELYADGDGKYLNTAGSDFV